MAITISLNKSKILYDASDDINDMSKLRSLAATIPGMNLSKTEPVARSNKDQILLSQVITMAKDFSINIELEQPVKNWYNAECVKVREFAHIFSSEKVEIPISYNSVLRAYQRSDVELLYTMKRAILGNDPGTGKTLDCIALADLVHAENILVLCPLSLMGSWRKEIEHWSDDADIKIIPPESNYKRKEKMQANLAEGHRWNISNYSILQRGRNKITNKYLAKDDFPELFDKKWDIVIVDEAHRLLNQKTQVTEGVTKLQSDYLILATGTSMTKNHYDIFSLLKLLDPNTFTSKWNFIDTYNYTEEKTIRTSQRTIRTKEIMRPRNKALFRYMLSKYMIRRRKEEVLPELPEVVHKNIYLELPSKDRKEYNLLADEMIALIDDNLLISQNVLAQQAKLRQFLLDKRLVLDNVAKTYVSPRLNAILDIVDSDDKPKIVFSTSRKFLHILQNNLTDKRVGVINGSVPFNERQEIVDALNRGELDVVLGTTQAMGEGLNMQAADTIIFADKTWVPSDQNQAISRAHRMGQLSDSVLVYNIIIKGTLDEQVEYVNKERTDIIDEMSALHLVLPQITGTRNKSML